MPDTSASIATDPKHWRDRAEEARAMAVQMSDREARNMMLDIAESYEKLAKRAEKRAAGLLPNQLARPAWCIHLRVDEGAESAHRKLPGPATGQASSLTMFLY